MGLVRRKTGKAGGRRNHFYPACGMARPKRVVGLQHPAGKTAYPVGDYQKTGRSKADAAPAVSRFGKEKLHFGEENGAISKASVNDAITPLEQKKPEHNENYFP